MTFTFAAAIAVGCTVPLTGHWDLGVAVSASQDEVFQDRHRTHFCLMNIFSVFSYLQFLDANLSAKTFSKLFQIYQIHQSVSHYHFALYSIIVSLMGISYIVTLARLSFIIVESSTSKKF